MTLDNFRIQCPCGNTEQSTFQTTMEDWDGYSEYTVMECGFFSVKCKKCGAFGSTNKNEKPRSNKMNDFIITCAKCESTNWNFSDSLDNESYFSDVKDTEPLLQCDDCGCEE